MYFFPAYLLKNLRGKKKELTSMRFVSESIALALCFCFICNGIVKKIILDCDHPRSTNLGLLQYCINLGRSLLELTEEDKKEEPTKTKPKKVKNQQQQN